MIKVKFDGINKTLPFVPGTTIKMLIDEMGISDSDIGLIAVNRKSQFTYYLIKDEDEIEFFPIALGG